MRIADLKQHNYGRQSEVAGHAHVWEIEFGVGFEYEVDGVTKSRKWVINLAFKQERGKWG